MFEAYTFVGSIVHPIGALERIVTQKLLDVVKRVAQKELESENLVHLVTRLSGRAERSTLTFKSEF